MITPPDYQVMGEDGQEYGPVTDEKIRAWVAEQRLERKSPVKPPGARDWVFLESLPEFADLFQSPAPPQPKRQLQKWPVAILIVLATGLIVLALKKIKHH
jgi:hypothetical protein